MRLLSYLLVILFPYPLFSQTINDYQKTKKAIENCPQSVIQMPVPASHPDIPKTLLPVSNIVVKDVREDTSYIGIQMGINLSSVNQRCRKTLFNKPLSSAFAEYMNQSPGFSLSSSPYSLVCFIKEFRITQRDSVINYTKTRLMYSRIALTAETFLVHGNDYFPAFKIDTAALVLIDEDNRFDAIPDMLTGLLQKCAAISIEKTEAKHAYTLAALEDRYNKASGKPILSAEKPQAGIYMTFDEFINNKPSFTKYEMKSDKLSASLYSVSPAGEATLQTKAFGYCDGSIIWLNIANDYYPLIRRQNTFEYIGDYHAINKKTGFKPGYFNQLNGSNATRLGLSAASVGISSLLMAYGGTGTVPTLRGKVIHQLNLETGEVY